MTATRCEFGCHAPAVGMLREFYRAVDGGIVCEANFVCAACARDARDRDAQLEAAGLLKFETTTTEES